MKLILFRGGKPGTAAVLPGDDPCVELSDLLGGQVDLSPLGHGMLLATLAEGEALRLPLRYAVHRLGRAPAPIAGDCAVVAINGGGTLTDVTAAQMEQARSFIRCI